MNSFIFKTLLLLQAVALCVPAFADDADAGGDVDDRYPYIIEGVVVDEAGEPLPGAAVRLVGTTFGAGTNTQGEFSIRVRNDDPCVLRVSFMGYEPTETTVTPSANKGEWKVKIALRAATNSLDEVVVTGLFMEKPLKDVPVLTRVISQKDIQALNPQSFEQLLQYELPGLQISYNTMSQLPEITYMGMEGEYILFLIDGERVSGEGADHNVDFTRFNVDDIERIEVIKGSQSTIYGSNALGGVINIITKTASKPFTGNLNARYAGSDGQKYTASAGLRKNRLTSYSSLTYRTRDTYSVSDLDDDGTASSTTTMYGYSIWDFTQKLGYTCNERLSVDLKGTYYHNKRDKREGYLYQDFFIDYALSGKIKYLIADNQQLVLSYIFDNYKKDKDFYVSGNTRTDYRNRTHTPRLDYTGTFGRHTVSVGAEGYFEYLKHYFMPDSSSVKGNSAAIYAQEDWKVMDNFDVVLGVRADWHEKYAWHVTPKVSLLYRPWKQLAIRAGYSQGFRSPSLKELYQEYDMGGLGYMMLYGNENLEPETSHQMALSVEYTQGGLNLSVSAAHNRFKNKITLQSLNDGTNDARYENAEKARTTSVEAIARYNFRFGLTLTGSYAYTDDYEEVSGYNTSYVRPHMATFNVLYSHKFGKIGTNISLNGQWACPFDRYSVRTSDDGEVTATKRSYDARTMCSLNAGVRLPRGISLNVGVDNLFNHKDKSSENGLQLPQNGISVVGTINLNLEEMFKL